MIDVIGLGAIGSYTSIALSKAGIEHNGWDYDVVERKNLQNQAFFPEHRRKNKAEACAEMSDKLTAIMSPWTTEQPLDIAIACADDMQVRRDITSKANVMFDTRLAGNTITLYASLEPEKLLETMQYDNDDVPDQVDTCHTPSSTLEVVLTAVGYMLANIKAYLNTGSLLWGMAMINVETGVLITTKE
jgi:molybdopterin/thiamine biosynthesis adenylyltransferase